MDYSSIQTVGSAKSKDNIAREIVDSQNLNNGNQKLDSNKTLIVHL